MNNRLEIHQWDSNDVRTAKQHLNGDITIGGAELRRILLAVIDDRERWISKTDIAYRLMLVRITTNEMFRTKRDRKLISAMLSEVREISSMLGISVIRSRTDSQTRTPDELNEATPNLLRRQAE